MSDQEVSREITGKRGAPKSQKSPDEARQRRIWQVAVATIITLAAVGFLSGTRASEYVARGFSEAPPASSADRAPNYASLRTNPHEANSGAYEGAIGVLRGTLPSLTDPVTKTPEEYQAAIAARAERRAYDGAPPVIPHSVDQAAAPDCLVCHQHGAKIAGKIAPMMSHERYDNCTQCHVEQSNPRMASLPPFEVENSFAGAASPGVGDRAWPGAPPTVPHRTLMRSRCESCHGVAGLNGLRTPHPDRQSCNQCHASGAGLDQRFPTFTPPALAEKPRPVAREAVTSPPASGPAATTL